MKQESSITVPAQTGRLDEVLTFAGGAARDAGLDIKQLNNVSIAVEEIFVNIAHYAYPSGEGDVTVSVTVSQDRLTIEFRDSGTPYDPLAKTDPDTSLSADEREIGGLGVFMVKKLMDGVSYRYEDGKNILTMFKDISS
jgi:anti-sigma regulatory factor (Ser/Thr protein kinase)